MLTRTRKLIKEVMKKKCTNFFSLFYTFHSLTCLLTINCDGAKILRLPSHIHRVQHNHWNWIFTIQKENSCLPDDFLEEWTNEYFRVESRVWECTRENEKKLYIIFSESAIAVGKCFYNFMSVWGKADDGMEERKKCCLHISFSVTSERESR